MKVLLHLSPGWEYWFSIDLGENWTQGLWQPNWCRIHFLQFARPVSAAVGASFFAPVNKTATDAFSASETQPRLSIIGQHGQHGQQGISHNTLDDRRAD